MSAREPKAQTSPGGILADAEILMAARHIHFDYMTCLHRAEGGDEQALLTLIELTPRISWAPAGYEDHAEVLLALYRQYGAEAFRAVFQRATPTARSQAATAMYAMSGYEEPLHLDKP